MKLKALIGSGIIVGSLAVSSVAGAAVTFDPDTGEGFVGKGDVQVPFGWNDSALQSKAKDVTFEYASISDDEYSVTCEWDTGTRKIVHHIQNKTANVDSSIAYDVTKADRKNPNGKITGFNLIGKGSVVESSTGSVPVVGDACPETGNDNGTDNSVDKRITDVELVSSTDTSTLTAYYLRGTLQQLSAVIWTPPVAPSVA